MILWGRIGISSCFCFIFFDFTYLNAFLLNQTCHNGKKRDTGSFAVLNLSPFHTIRLKIQSTVTIATATYLFKSLFHFFFSILPQLHASYWSLLLLPSPYLWQDPPLSIRSIVLFLPIPYGVPDEQSFLSLFVWSFPPFL